MNLERYAAEHGQNIAHMVTSEAGNQKVDGDKAENCVRKALGVLQESGLFACVLYCLSEIPTEQSSNDEVRAYGEIVRELFGLLMRDETKRLGLAFAGSLEEGRLRSSEGKRALLDHVRDHLLADHRTTFLVRTLFEQTLTYALFGIKALK